MQRAMSKAMPPITFKVKKQKKPTYTNLTELFIKKHIKY